MSSYLIRPLCLVNRSAIGTRMFCQGNVVGGTWGNIKKDGQPERVQKQARFSVIRREHLKSGAARPLKGGTIIYEDEWFVGINKLSGVAVQGGTDQEEESHLDFELHERNWKLVHRLDMDTSGVLLVAKSKEAAAKFSKLFRDYDVGVHNENLSKQYLALVLGTPKNTIGTIKVPVRGAEAFSKYSVISSGTKGDLSVLRMNPVSGRKHQLRIHCRYGLGYGIVGDSKYPSITPLALKLNRENMKLCLHSHRLSFRHPFTMKKTTIEAPIPSYMQKTCARFGASLEEAQKVDNRIAKRIIRNWSPRNSNRAVRSETTSRALNNIKPGFKNTGAPQAKPLPSQNSSFEHVRVGYGRLATGMTRRIRKR